MMIQFITEMLAILCWGVGYHSYNVFCGLINSCHIPAVCARVDAYASFVPDPDYYLTYANCHVTYISTV